MSSRRPSSSPEKKRRRKRQRAAAPRAAYTVPEFCEAHRISRATFYNAKKRGRGPAVMYVEGRVIITQEAAAEWRREGTAAALRREANA